MTKKIQNVVNQSTHGPVKDIMGLGRAKKANFTNLTLSLNWSTSEGQPRVIIYINLVDLESLMLHLKIIRLLVMEKKNFKVFIIYGQGSHPGHVTKTIFINLCSPSQGPST